MSRLVADPSRSGGGDDLSTGDQSDLGTGTDTGVGHGNRHRHRHRDWPGRHRSCGVAPARVRERRYGHGSLHRELATPLRSKITGKDRTGVSAGAINLAVHAPVTGAAPLPAESFEKSNDIYWKHVTETLGEKVLGR